MASAAASAVLGDPIAFEALVAQLLLPDNDARTRAEAVFDGLKAHPDGCVQHLLRCLRQSPAVENRAFCAIMLRKVCAMAGGGAQACSVRVLLLFRRRASSLTTAIRASPRSRRCCATRSQTCTARAARACRCATRGFAAAAAADGGGGNAEMMRVKL